MKKLLCAIALMLTATVANAATVTFTLDNRVAGTWSLYANSSAGDNTGIAGYSVELAPANITSLVHSSIRIAEVSADGGGTTGSAGFAVLRSPNNIVTGLAVGGGQDNVTPSPFLVKNWGQTSSSFATQYPAATPESSVVGGTWTQQGLLGAGVAGDTFPTVPLGVLIASGNRGAGPVGFLIPSSALTFANVFTGAGSQAAPATVQTRNISGAPIPEPATLGMASMALLGLAAFRRRS